MPPEDREPGPIRAARATHAALKHFVGALVLVSIGVMGVGVILRYVMLPITEALGQSPISFFWVEEVGELTLAWTALVGAAVGIAERTHFALALFTQHLPQSAQRVIRAVNHVIIAGFGGFVAWQGWIVLGYNRGIVTPALEISMAWLFASLVAGGTLIVIYALATIARVRLPEHHVVE